MKVHLIEDLKEQFKAYLLEADSYEEIYKYECINTFQEHWNIDANNLAQMYDRSLTSKISSRLWGGRRNSAKSFMLSCFELHPDFMRSAFIDLFDEEKEIALRISRFQFYCDEMLGELQKKNKKLNFHFHDLRMISVYLSLKYPAVYSIFHFKPFLKLMEDVEVPELPKDFEIERFFKLSKGIFTLLSKDEALMQAHQKHIQGSEFWHDSSMVIVHDLMSWNKFTKGKS